MRKYLYLAPKTLEEVYQAVAANADKDKGRYRYPDGSENYDFNKSVFAKK